MSQVTWKKVLNGTVTSAKGFSASGMHIGIKRKNMKHDISLIYSATPCNAAGVFTKNSAKAWCVLHAQKNIKNAKHHAVLASSGNANCLNGPKGKTAIEQALKVLAKQLNISEGNILSAQTGIIGVEFPTQTVLKGLPTLVQKLGSSRKHGADAAKGILTTDLRTKESAVSFQLGQKKVTVGGISKGSGMIHPNMATMLGFITTDCAISKKMLTQALRYVNHLTFNKIAVDNDMSTNDMVFVLANGEAGNKEITKEDADYKKFVAALQEVARVLAYEIVLDGEGATHVCTLHVEGAKNDAEAEKAARQIANSMLFKTMLAGADPNWGRIAAAVGSSGAKFNSEEFSLFFESVKIVDHGKVFPQNREKARQVLLKREYQIRVIIGKGKGKMTFITSDLTAKYVAINTKYS